MLPISYCTVYIEKSCSSSVVYYTTNLKLWQLASKCWYREPQTHAKPDHHTACITNQNDLGPSFNILFFFYYNLSCYFALLVPASYWFKQCYTVYSILLLQTSLWQHTAFQERSRKEAKIRQRNGCLDFSLKGSTRRNTQLQFQVRMVGYGASVSWIPGLF